MEQLNDKTLKLSKHHLAVFALIIANLIWGAAAPVFKWSLQDIEPFTLAFLRFFIAALILLPFTMHKLHIKKQDWTKLALLSILGITISISLFFIGLTMSSSINAPIIGSSAPVFIILGSIFFLGEMPKRKVIIGTVTSLIGVLIIVLQPIIEKGMDGTVIGNLLFIFAMFGGVGHTILLRGLAKSYSALTLTFWSFLIGSVTFIPMMFGEVQTHGFLTNLSNQGLIGILFGAFLSSALAYYLFNLALKYMVASEASIFTYMDPIIAILIAVPLLNESITVTYLIGSALVFLGISIAEKRVHWHPLHKLKLQKLATASPDTV
ncbi:MAG: DMT family transporter [Candidatus Levybacteria bacterium]|nr:DMT family transporter [Candidatus Levybacteria bacterium]